MCGGFHAKFQLSRTNRKKSPPLFHPKLRFAVYATVWSGSLILFRVDQIYLSLFLIFTPFHLSSLYKYVYFDKLNTVTVNTCLNLYSIKYGEITFVRRDAVQNYCITNNKLYSNIDTFILLFLLICYIQLERWSFAEPTSIYCWFEKNNLKILWSNSVTVYTLY